MGITPDHAAFQIFAAIQSSTVKEQKKLDEEFRINQIEVQKIIDAGVANFTPEPQAIEWPRLARQEALVAMQLSSTMD